MPSRRSFIKGCSAGIAGAGVLGATGAAFAADEGNLVVTVYADDEVLGGQVQSEPFSGVTVADGSWRNYDNRLGRTDDNGVLSATLEGGEHSLSVHKMVSSHTTVSKSGIDVTITPGETTYLDIHVAPKTVKLTAHADPEWGKALYVTGETDYLGNWATARKLDPGRDAWRLTDNLPTGAKFKIVKADWVDGDTIPTSNVTWESGPNHTLEGTFLGDGIHVDVYPTF